MTENQKKAENMLDEVKCANNNIKKMRESIEAKRLAALPGAITYDKDRVQTSPSNFTESVLVDAADMEAELKEYICSVDKLKLTIYSDIVKLEELDQQNVLMYYYFDDMNWMEVADRIAVSESKVFDIRNDALENFGMLQNME